MPLFFFDGASYVGSSRSCHWFVLQVYDFLSLCWGGRGELSRGIITWKRVSYLRPFNCRAYDAKDHSRFPLCRQERMSEKGIILLLGLLLKQH